jgi:hypothetical protein
VIGTLATARKGHAAARLSDGRVLIAGGFTGAAVLGSTELFDPATNAITAGPALNVARAGLSATTLMDGKVLFFGGNDGVNDLASAEIYTPETQSIWPSATGAAIARRDHQAFLLPNNNAVLFVGGVSDDAAAASAELYLPWRGEFWATGAMATPRFTGAGSALSVETYGDQPSGEGLLMMAGGEALGSSEAYRFATIRTDKDDYSPGMKVYVSASGWQPNETVTFGLRELPAEHESRTFTIQADGTGTISDAFLFDVEQHHLGVRFYLTARGAASQAQITFTDATGTLTALTSNNNPSNFGGSVTFTATVTESVGGAAVAVGTVAFWEGGNNNCSGGAVRLSPDVALTAANGGIVPFTTSSLTLGPHTIRACYVGTGGSGTSSSSNVLTQTVNPAAATTTGLATSGSPSIYGGAVTFTATVSPNVGSSGSVDFKDGLTTICSGAAVSGSVATCVKSNLSAGTHSITAVYNGAGGFAGSTSSAVSQVVNQKALTVTGLSANSRVYDATTAATIAGTAALQAAEAFGTGRPPMASLLRVTPSLSLGRRTAPLRAKMWRTASRSASRDCH